MHLANLTIDGNIVIMIVRLCYLLCGGNSFLRKYCLLIL